eukprot:3988908-Pleurochrysis_carterae.AAC.2
MYVAAHVAFTMFGIRRGQMLASVLPISKAGRHFSCICDALVPVWLYTDQMASPPLAFVHATKRCRGRAGIAKACTYGVSSSRVPSQVCDAFRGVVLPSPEFASPSSRCFCDRLWRVADGEALLTFYGHEARALFPHSRVGLPVFLSI